jgi:hypothetical protein
MSEAGFLGYKLLVEGRSKLQSGAFQLFCGQWMLGTLASFWASLLVVEVGERPELGTMEGTLGGVMVGAVQSLLLSQYFSQTWLWAAANGVSWGLLAGSGLGAMGWVAPSTDSLSLRCFWGAVFGAIGGLWLGSWQWLVLREKVVGAWRWIVVTAASWSFALAVGWLVGGWLHSTTHLFLGEVMGLAVTWTIVGGMTGLAVILLPTKTKYRRTKSENLT